MASLIHKIIVVLVEPNGPLNIGSVARLCGNFGVKELRLVAPRCDYNNEDAKRMAVKGRQFIETAQIFPSLIDSIKDCPKVIATCGRIDHGDIPLEEPEQALNWLLKSSESSNLALIFGREDNGLTNQELLLAQKILSIKTIDNYRSLNLSHAVAIVLHEIHRCEQSRSNQKSSLATNAQPALPSEINDCINETEKLLLEIGFLYRHTANARMNKIRALLQRAEIRTQEIAMIRGILRQTRWALNRENSSNN